MDFAITLILCIHPTVKLNLGIVYISLFVAKECYSLIHFIIICSVDSKSDKHDRVNIFSENLNWDCYYYIYAGCMAALDAEHYLQEIGSQEGKSD